MHERVEVDVPALLLTLVIVALVSLGLIHQVRIRAARQIELQRLQQILAAENEQHEKLAEQEYTSMLATPRNSTTISSPNPPQQQQLAAASLCAVCDSPTNSRCSRCKSIHYCSSKCQVTHWRQGHKNECLVAGAEKPTPKPKSEPISLAVPGTKKLKNTEASPRAHVISPKPAPAEVEVKKLCLQTSESKSDESNVTSDGSLVKPKKILFPYGRFVHYFNWDFRRPPCGLINCGNSCFANVILQCLSYTRPLAAYLLEGSHRAECRRNDWCFMCELQDHALRVFNSEVPFSPFRILSRLRDIGNHLGYGRQEDAHEFMRFAVDSMQSICLDQFGGEKQVDSRSQETTLIQYIFGGHLQSQVKCMQCGHESNRYENMMDLAVEIQGAVESLEDGLAQFTAPEWLDGENKYKCDRCNGYVKASKRLSVYEAPNILTIALKRFQSGKFGKLNKRVTFPEALNISPYMSGEGDKPPLYRLYAVVVHVDMLNASFFGHYICYVRDMTGTWYKVDDSKVKEVDTEKVMSQKAYMLMYSRSSARPGPETAVGSVASTITDVSVSNGRKCSSSSCKYQQSSSIGQVHDQVHRVSPIIAGTLIDNSLVEESVGPSYSTLQTTTIEKVIELGFDDSDSITGSSQEIDRISSPNSQVQMSHELAECEVTSPSSPQRRKAAKRRLETSDAPRTRSLSCPPAAKSPASPSQSHQLADDLPRSFGYSLAQRDKERLTAADKVESPSKRQHLLQERSSSMEGDNEVSNETSSKEGGAEEEPASPSMDELDQSLSLPAGELHTSTACVQQALSGTTKDGNQDMKKEPPRKAVNGVVLKPVFAKGFLDRSVRRVLNTTNREELSPRGSSRDQQERQQREIITGKGDEVSTIERSINSGSSSSSNSSSRKLGRNDSCSCGSQRKWKKCCGMVKEIESSRRLVA
ncbi:ubiquitin carboxyl-terminal hydrolase 18 [Selaginella moellendorffii]|uniref:ubiquitin carboxyl-terminal hydrolase 18 n=1 Tax=Selaginella moellendorffii TaxID=88036 RepID=UPI000D1C9364|nr:ubiquitin carboxyl-terminal hydrolase 18 [Selaginella moellendorffii]|eukprot:XP_024541160.1 ubiquitin carboxyl-terminal hydrolase 18 [Selaginella moellendorffii]